MRANAYNPGVYHLDLGIEIQVPGQHGLEPEGVQGRVHRCRAWEVRAWQLGHEETVVT